MSKDLLFSNQEIENRIFLIRGNQVMIDRDLAELYGVETKVLNQAVKRNLDRFPEEFRFQINKLEKDELVTKCDRFQSLKHSSSNPFAFTEQGIAMLSAVLRSEIAVKVSIQIIKAFVAMRKLVQDNQLVGGGVMVDLRGIVWLIKSESKYSFERIGLNSI
ncbi:hypothetical protein Aoki45_03670 [Algoriphagus sp. oki45]|uniref:ORF6N domain-containing protein n=1 Tax=Algoriphagus sp. oki45 TaxID=3067294 RepID=UPI0027F5EDAC|nr:hypothetical protein Aoki45_03670 [Algoriphagus sp. oki45]